MKKTKKVASYILLLVPLALPAACSPVTTSGRASSSHDGSSHAEAEDDSEELRLIVERYLEQQELLARRAAAATASTSAVEAEAPAAVNVEAPAASAKPAAAAEPDAAVDAAASDDEAEEPTAAAPETEEELKEELAELEKTGEWTADEGSVQCLVPQPTPVPAEAERKVEVVKSKGKAACAFPVVVNKQVQFYVNLFQNRQKKNFKHWLERSTIYLPSIARELEKAGLPPELGYLAMIESGFNPMAYSPSHAAGLWQFIPGTARNYGLRVDSWRDERRDPEKSTKAAIAYLKALHKRFKDWQLAVAAYNAGEGMVEQGMKKHKSKNFWELARHGHLRMETKRYVPQLIAAVMIARNPEQYGFKNLRYKKPLQHDVVKVPGGTSLQTVAACASLSVGELRRLNSELLKDAAPSGRQGYLLKVPVGSGVRVAANLPKARTIALAAAAESASEDYKTHKVAKNETLKQISKQYNVSMTNLLKANSLHSSKLRIGQSLRIPVAAALGSQHDALLAQGSSAEDGPKTVRHKLGKGETLSSVAAKHDVSVAELMKWNKIAKASKVRAGQQLVLHVQPQAAAATQQASASEPQKAGNIVELVAQGRKVKLDGESAKPTTVAETARPAGKKRTVASPAEAEVSYYRVRNGDSLWSIAQKLQISAQKIKRWNSLVSNLLRPGTKLIIKNG